MRRCWQFGSRWQLGRGVGACAVLLLLLTAAPLQAGAQENPIETPNTPKPPAPAPKQAPPVLQGSDVTQKGTSARGSTLRVDVDLVLVPVTVTDGQERLVTGLEKENFELFDSNVPQTIKSFSTEDAPHLHRDRLRPEWQHAVEVPARAQGTE